MYKIENKSEDFYIFNMETKQYINIKFSLKELIDYVARYNSTPFLTTKYSNEILDNINMNFKDKNPCLYLSPTLYNMFPKVYSGELKKYVILDGYLRIVDLRDYKKEILEKGHYKYRSSWRISYSKSNVNKANLVNFRAGPIPGICKSNIKDYRIPKVMNELKNCYDETEKYIRPKRKAKSLIQEVKPRYTQKSWKTQNKKKFQWM